MRNNGSSPPPDGLDPVARLARDLKNAARILSDREARFLVDAYYAMQRDRIRAGHQELALDKSSEPHDIMSWLMLQRYSLEKQVAGALNVYSASKPIGQWARSICGIGPIISAGLLAHIYMGYWCQFCHGTTEEGCKERQANPKLKLPYHAFQPVISCPTVGHIWRFAGLDPTLKWEKRKKRPWNGSLKRLCFLIGESFVKVCNRDDDVYGHVYAERKDWESSRNATGAYKAQAEHALATKDYDPASDAIKHYQAGHLPPAHIHMRAKRYATKLFLAHYHQVLFELTFRQAAPKPYVIEHGGHTHFIAPPNWPMPTRGTESTTELE